MRETRFIEYRNYLYFKLTIAMVAIATISYLVHDPASGRHGGTWLGYTLGGIAAAIVLLLLWFGVRKRQYRNATGTLLGWLSAHVYLGTALVFIVTLHTGFEFGLNVHTLSYVLMLVVVASGFYGVYAYLRYPRLLTDTMGEETLDTLFLKIADLDQQARRIALRLPDEINTLVLEASQKTRIGGGVFRQLGGRQPNCPTTFAVERLEQLGSQLSSDQARLNRELYFVMLRKLTLVQRARADVMFRARLQFWLYVHVPLAIAMLAALIAHVVSVFFYW